MAEVLQTFNARVNNKEKVKSSAVVDELLAIFQQEEYIMSYQDHSQPFFVIALRQGSDSATQLKAWLHALILANHLSTSKQRTPEKPGRQHLPRSTKNPTGQVVGIQASLSSTLVEANNVFEMFRHRLETAGWNMCDIALETTMGPRLVVDG